MKQIEIKNLDALVAETKFPPASHHTAIHTAISGDKLFRKDERKAASDLDAKIARLRALEDDLSFDGVRRAYRAQQAAHASNVASGEHDKLLAAPGLSQDELFAQANEKRRAVRDEMKKATEQLWQIVLPVRARWVEAARDLAAEMADAERQTAEKFGLPYEPSKVVLSILKAAAVIADSKAIPCTGTRLATMLPGLVVA